MRPTEAEVRDISSTPIPLRDLIAMWKILTTKQATLTRGANCNWNEATWIVTHLDNWLSISLLFIQRLPGTDCLA